MIPTIDELRDAWSDRMCPDLDASHHEGCPAAIDFNHWLESVLTSAYDRGYSDGFDARG